VLFDRPDPQIKLRNELGDDALHLPKGYDFLLRLYPYDTALGPEDISVECKVSAMMMKEPEVYRSKDQLHEDK